MFFPQISTWLTPNFLYFSVHVFPYQNFSLFTLNRVVPFSYFMFLMYFFIAQITTQNMVNLFIIYFLPKSYSTRNHLLSAEKYLAHSGCSANVCWIEYLLRCRNRGRWQKKITEIQARRNYYSGGIVMPWTEVGRMQGRNVFIVITPFAPYQRFVSVEACIWLHFGVSHRYKNKQLNVPDYFLTSTTLC